MSIDDRDYTRDKASFRFRTLEQQKRKQAKELKIRFANYSGSPGGIIRPFRGKRFLFLLLLLALGGAILARVPQVSGFFQLGQSSPQFPANGEARWFIPVSANGSGALAPLTITGVTGIGRNIVVKLDIWDTHAPVVLIPIRGGESVTLQVPLGRYRITYAQNASWQSDLAFIGAVQEGVEPLDFYRSGNQIMGHRIDLNSQINGNLKTRSIRNI
jgi:hypothetical protein